MKSSAQQQMSDPQEKCSWVEEVYRAYSQLTSTFALDREQGMGGALVYAGQLSADRGPSSADAPADAWIAAANIAGAATLAAAPTPEAQRRAMRDALVDFVVNSMEEALRILKNEIRQRRAVSVAVAVSQEHLLEEMLKHGVQPEAVSEEAMQALQHARMYGLQHSRVLETPQRTAGVFVSWMRDSCCTQKQDGAEAAALELAVDPIRQRWLRLAPRYLGRAAQRRMGVELSPQEAARWRQLTAANSLPGGKLVEPAGEGSHSEACLR